MINELVVPQMCIVMRNGIEIWANADKVQEFQNDIENSDRHFFARFNGESVNTADIVGVFTPQTLEDHNRRKNGQWKCLSGKWHERGVKCDCPTKEQQEYIIKRAEAIKNCPNKCNNGFITIKNSTYPHGATAMCDCIKSLQKPEQGS